MSEVKQSSGFKYVFWGISFLFFLALLGQVMWVILGGLRPVPYFLGFGSHHPFLIESGTHWLRLAAVATPTIILFLIWVGVVGSIVYRDANKRGMDPYLWATVAVFIPFFLGIIIYLVVRSNGRTVCEKCGKPIHSDYKICPFCSHCRELLCSGCSRPIDPEWKVCPYCERRLVPAP